MKGLILIPALLFLIHSAPTVAGPPSYIPGAPGYTPIFPELIQNDDQGPSFDGYDETDYDWSAEPTGFNPFLSETGELLIITSKKYSSDLGDFIRWKKQMGHNVFVSLVDDIGNSEKAITNEIKAQFKESNVRFVILIGDHDDVATHTGSLGNVWRKAADPMYALIDDDIYPDLYISRIPVNDTSELKVTLNKIIRYEREPDTENDWYSNGASIGSSEGGRIFYDLNDEGEKVAYPGEADVDIAKELAQILLGAGYTDIQEYYDRDGSAKKELLSEQLNNEGAGLIYYMGHGVEHEWKTTMFNNDDIDALKNFDKTPVIISVACLNGNFEWVEGDSFAETWLTAGTEERGTGAVAILASTVVQPWVPPTVGLKDMINSIATDKYETIGGIFTNGIIKFLRKKKKDIIQTFQSWHIFGDATVKLRTKLPEEISYSINSDIDLLEDFEFEIEKGVLLTIVQDNKLIARTTGNSFEQLEEVKREGQLIVTISGKDKIPVELQYEFNGERFIQK